MVPGIALAGLATLGLGLVLGPEAPLIAIGSGVAVTTVKLAKRDAPPTMLLVLGAAGAFAAISVIFGSPIVGAVIIIEASGLGGETLPLILIPGLIAGGIGSLVFIGMTHWTALSTADYTLPPLHLAPLGTPTPGEIAWSILIGVAAALVTYPIRKVGLGTAALVTRRGFLLIPLAGLTVALVAFAYAQITSDSPNAVLFSGQEGLGTLVGHAADLSVGTLIYLTLFKSAAWAISLGSFRGGPAFPALFIGAAGGIALSHLPGLPSSVAIAVGIGAMFVAFLRLPLSAIIISGALCATAGAGIAPLIIVGVAAAYLATLAIEGRLGAAGNSTEPTDPDPGTLRTA